MPTLPETAVAPVTTLLCDVDGNLFPSEEPAFEASATVFNRVLASVGIDRRWDPVALREAALGRNFRALLTEGGILPAALLTDDDVERWVQEENRVVADHLATVLVPDPVLVATLERMSMLWDLAAVSSSALARLDRCFRATGLDALFPEHARFSAQDSLPSPTSKPDPAVYVLAGRALGIRPEQALAVEDAESGVRSAVAAGFTTIGNVVHVAVRERARRRDQLLDAGATLVVQDWAEVEALLPRTALRTAAP